MPGTENANIYQAVKVSHVSFHVPIEVLFTRLKNELEILSNNLDFPSEIRTQMPEQSNKVQAQIDDHLLRGKLSGFEKMNFLS